MRIDCLYFMCHQCICVCVCVSQFVFAKCNEKEIRFKLFTPNKLYFSRGISFLIGKGWANKI